MNLPETLLLFVSMLGLAALPSSSVALVVTRAATHGFRQGAAATAGIVLGDLIFVCLAVLGMAALADLLGSLFLLLRYLAGFILICLGLSLLLDRNPASRQEQCAGPPSYTLSFLSGLALTLGDIKAIVFYASFLPAFVDVQALTPGDLALLSLVTVLGVGSVKLGYAWAAGSMPSRQGRPGSIRRIRLFAGWTLTGTGAWLIAKP